MPDLYLQALMQGQIIKKNLNQATNNTSLDSKQKNKFEIEIENRLHAHLNALSTDEDPTQNRFMTPTMKLAKIKEELKESLQFSDLSENLENAFKLLAVFTSSDRISAKREAPDGAVDDEGIASAIAKETDAPDGRLPAGRKLTEEENMAKLLMEPVHPYLDLKEQAALSEQLEVANQALEDLELDLLASANFQELLQFTDSSLRSILKIAKGKFNEKLYSGSLALYILLATLVPENSMYWLYAGIAAQECENYAFAKRLYASAYSLDPSSIASLIYTIECCLKQNLLSEAEVTYAEALKLNEISPVDEPWKSALSNLKVILNQS